MAYSKITRSRVLKAKRAFTTRRVPSNQMRTLITGDVRPQSGNLVLATVVELGKHQKIERPNGRRALMMPGDEIIVCYGNRYAPDQFEALVSDDLGLCDLVAGGGIASREIARHDRMLPPTRIQPIGLIGDADGRPLNVFDYRVDYSEGDRSIQVVLVVGTAMNAGKTFTAASVIKGLKDAGYRVAGIKATGTGSGGDLWKMKDMGAEVVLDFTDAGFASTYKIPDETIEEGVLGLINQAARRRCSFAVVEIADGLQHRETATLLRSERLKERVSKVVFAAYDSLGARAGYEELCALGYQVEAISGQVTRSPLAMREVGESVDCPLYTPIEIQMGALVATLAGRDYPAYVPLETLDEEDLVPDNVADFVLAPEDRREGLRTRRLSGLCGFDFPNDHEETA